MRPRTLLASLLTLLPGLALAAEPVKPADSPRIKVLSPAPQVRPAADAGTAAGFYTPAIGQGGMSEALNDDLFRLLDANKDGKLSREELAKAPEILLRLDADEDEMVTVQELLPDPAPQQAIRVAV